MKVARWLYLVAVFSIPFSTDIFLGGFPGRDGLPRFQEFSALFFYGAEGFMLLASAAFLRAHRKERVLRDAGAGVMKEWPLLFLFLLFLLAALGLGTSPAGAVLFFRVVLALSFAGVTAVFLRASAISFTRIAGVIAASALFQAVLGIVQIIRQRSAGLWFLGEPVVDFWTTNVGRVPFEGGRLLRAFGTFPHANIYAAFLVLGLGALCYLFLKESERVFSSKRIALSFGMLLLLTSLLFSFSRSGWIGAGVLIFILAALGALSPPLRFRIGVLLARLAVVVVFLLFAFGHWAIPRASIPLDSDPSFNYRLRYNEIGFETIAKNPLGVGLGNQVAYGVQAGLYDRQGIGAEERWNWQPIHNLYLLIGAEAGIPTLVAFVAFLVVLAARGIKTFLAQRVGDPTAFLAALGVTAGFLTLGLADHYFWDLASGRLMFWLVLGIIVGLSPRRSMDRTLASEAGN